MIIDKFLIPADPKEYRWLTNNMDTINSVYDRQKKINEDTQNRLFSAKRIVKDRQESILLKEQLSNLTNTMISRKSDISHRKLLTRFSICVFACVLTTFV